MVDKMSPKGPMAYMILSLPASLVVWYLHGLPTSAAHESDIWVEREILVSLVLLLFLQFWTVPQAWNLDL